MRPNLNWNRRKVVVVLACAALGAAALLALAGYELGRRAASVEPGAAAHPPVEAARSNGESAAPGRGWDAWTSSAPGGPTPGAARPDRGPSRPAADARTVLAEPASAAAAAVQRAPAPPADARECAAYAARVEPLLRRWESLVATLPAASGVTRDRTLEQLRAVQADVASLGAPACAAGAQADLAAAMTRATDALSVAPSGEDPTGFGAFQDARADLARARAELAELRAEGD